MKRLRYWLPLLLWTAAILGASIDLFSAGHTDSLTQRIAAAILGHPLAPETLAIVQVVTRKLGHLTAYGLLGWLAFRAFRGERQGARTSWMIAAVAYAIAIAAVDELHQSFVPSRTGTPIDVLIDACGATLAQFLRRLPAGASRSS